MAATTNHLNRIDKLALLSSHWTGGQQTQAGAWLISAGRGGGLLLRCPAVNHAIGPAGRAVGMLKLGKPTLGSQLRKLYTSSASRTCRSSRFANFS